MLLQVILIISLTSSPKPPSYRSLYFLMEFTFGSTEESEDGSFSFRRGSSSSGSERKRKVVEHICLLKAKEDLPDDEEGIMLDCLYTTQYQMSDIAATSLGRVSAQNPESYVQALYIRFERKESLAKFYKNPFYLKILKEHPMPCCHACTNMH